MHIQVTDVLYDEETKLTMVEFSTPFGIGVGEWRYGSPERYSHHDIEIETAFRLTWGKDIQPAKDEQFVIDYDLDHLVTLQGKLESVESDGVAYVRIGSSLVTIKTDIGEALPLDTFVRIHADKIILFPYDT
ncbi:MAG: hypothetical protein GY796_20175 [Chloroflexi bacterium]|nr:hypothetical protein [Chloroflexota bacterium]